MWWPTKGTYPSDSSEDKWQLFRPENHRETVLADLHYDHGDLGPKRTFKLLHTSGEGSVLVVTKHFTRYAQSFPIKDQQAAR
ncbi:hypothetical protein E2320_019853, partial [Naja naja]